MIVTTKTRNMFVEVRSEIEYFVLLLLPSAEIFGRRYEIKLSYIGKKKKQNRGKNTRPEYS